MRSIEKLWTVVYTIDQALDITPSGKPCRIPEATLTGKIHYQDVDSVIEKLEKDEKVIKIISQPKRNNFESDFSEDKNNYVLKVLPNFKEYKNRIYAKYTFGLDNITYFNLLKLLDVALDIKEKLQLTDENEVNIKALPPIIKFSQLMPADEINFRDQYMSYRLEAVECLKKMNAIVNFSEYSNLHRWDTTFEIEVDRLEFDQVFGKLKEKVKVEKSNKNQADSSKNTETDTIKYDKANHTLLIGSVQITFNKDDSNQAELCRVLLENKGSANKNWNTDEMLGAWGWPEDRICDENGKLLKENRLKVYTAAEKINTKVMKTTNGKVNDFLVFSTKSVSLNSKYREMLANK